jgi:hypothetical protein
MSTTATGGGNIMNTSAVAPERVSDVATTEKPRKKIIKVQIVHHLLALIIIKISLADAPERVSDVAPTIKPQKKTK